MAEQTTLAAILIQVTREGRVERFGRMATIVLIIDNVRNIYPQWCEPEDCDHDKICNITFLFTTRSLYMCSSSVVHNANNMTIVMKHIQIISKRSSLFEVYIEALIVKKRGC